MVHSGMHGFSAPAPASTDRSAERVLEQREKQLADAQQIAQLGSWEWDIDSGCMAWSDEQFRIAGYEPASFDPTFDSFLDAAHPADRALVQTRLEDGITNPSCLSFEYRVRRPDGVIRFLSCRAEVVTAVCGAPVRVIGTSHDVSEIRHFAGALASQVEQLQQLSHASVAIYAAEGVEEILEVATGQAMRIVGARRALGCISEADGRNERRVELSRGSREAVAALDVLSGLEPLHHPIRLDSGEVERHPAFRSLPEAQREPLWRGWIAVPLVEIVDGGSGAIQLFEKEQGDFSEGDEAILTQMAQITSLALQKARLFERLQSSEERYRRLFDSHLSGDFIIDAEGRFVEANRTFARILGFDSPERLGDVNISSLYRHPRERQWLLKQIHPERRAIQYETEFVRTDHEVVQVIMNVVGIFNRANELTGLQGCVFDSTDRKRAEAALRDSQQQLLQAQKMEAVGQLAGGIAHDFNNMLMAIQGFADLLEEEIPPTPSARSHLAEIRKAADRSARLTRQLLAYSRKQVLQPEIVELNSVVAGMEDMLRRLIGAHMAFVVALEPEAGRVHADPGQLQQVLMNLVLNARDAMPGGGRLVVRTGVRLQEHPTETNGFTLPAGRYGTLSVADTGCGMEPEVLQRVFEPFFTTKPVGGGSGLGLSTAYGVVKQSGGFIQAESQPGKGSTFSLFLPLTDSPLSVSPASQRHGGAFGTGATVLIAEDESVLRSLAALVLRRGGYRVLEAEDGQHALELAEAEDFQVDVLLTDLVMPRMGGEPLAERMLEHRPTLKVIFMSGYAEEAVDRCGAMADGSIFLEKPYSPTVLAQAVHDVLAESGTPQRMAD